MIRDAGTLRQVNVRFPTEDRDRLTVVASAQQRTLSQLVRWAVDAWLATYEQTGTLAPGHVTLGPHVNVKLPQQTRERLLAASPDGTLSTSIRAAVSWWLDEYQAETVSAGDSRVLAPLEVV